MDRDEIVGNVTTIGKFILLTFGTPSLVSFANSNDYVKIVAAAFGLIWAFYDSKYFNTFFDKNKQEDDDPVMSDEDDMVLNDEYEVTGDEDGA